MNHDRTNAGITGIGLWPGEESLQPCMYTDKEVAMRRERILTVMSTKQHTARHSLTTTTYMLPGLRLDVLERLPGTELGFHF